MPETSNLPFAWTEKRANELRTLWTNGATASEIAREFGCSRNAVIGKARRMNLEARRSTPVQALRTIRAERPAGHRNGAQPKVQSIIARKARLDALPPPQVTESLPADPVPPLAPVVPLLDLKSGQCRYPIGDPLQKGFGFCGAPQRALSSYCEHHHQRCHAGVSP